MKKIVLSLVALGIVEISTLLALFSNAYAANLYVPRDYPTIQAAINAAKTGDIVWVADGIYKGKGNKNLTWRRKRITVRSINGPNNCIIDCQGSGRGFYFYNAGNCGTISGFTIRNGSSAYGGGIFCGTSSPTIINCTISDNSAYAGGGILCYNSSPQIINCTITNNSAYYYDDRIYCHGNASLRILNYPINGNSSYNSSGGGICCINSSPRIINCTISNNSADDSGGIHCYNSLPQIINCIINNNSATWYGGGISCHDSSPQIINCTIHNNFAGNNGGGICCWYNSSPTVTNSILWGNSPEEIYLGYQGTITITYSNIRGGWKGEGNINADPQFIGKGVYHLKPTSYCIDKGTNTPTGGLPVTDKDGKPRIVNGRIDMGAYEYQGTYKKPKKK